MPPEQGRDAWAIVKHWARDPARPFRRRCPLVACRSMSRTFATYRLRVDPPSEASAAPYTRLPDRLCAQRHIAVCAAPVDVAHAHNDLPCGLAAGSARPSCVKRRAVGEPGPVSCGRTSRAARRSASDRDGTDGLIEICACEADLSVASIAWRSRKSAITCDRSAASSQRCALAARLRSGPCDPQRAGGSRTCGAGHTAAEPRFSRSPVQG